MKVHLFYLLDEDKGYLYAYTATKELANMFMEQRNMKLFKHKVRKMEEVEFQAFFKTHQTEKIVEDYVNDVENTLKVAVTISESDQISESCNYIVQMVEYVKQRYDTYGLKQDYQNAILSLCDSLLDDDNELYVDSIKLFTYLFRNTFYKSPHEKSGLQFLINNNDG